MPIPDKPTVPEVMPLIREYYTKPANGCGGNLHIILEDPNFEDCHVQFCLKEAEKEEDEDGARIARLMLRMSKTQRKKLYRNHDYPPDFK